MTQDRESNESRTAHPHIQARVEGPENLERIRDLLFGTQMRGFDSRLEATEERLLRELAGFREETRNTLESLETFVRSELQSLSDRINSDQDKRGEALRKLTGELRETGETLERKIGELDNRVETRGREMREQLLTQTKLLNDGIAAKHEEALRIMEQSAVKIRSDHIDRSNLSRLFTELAVRVDHALAGQVVPQLEEENDEERPRQGSDPAQLQGGSAAEG